MQQSTTIIQDNSANPAPLGLLAFGMTTILLNLHNAGFFEMNSMIIAMGLFYGGLAQIVAGILESKKNNTFGMTAFVSYGFFWLTLVALLLLPKWNLMPAPSVNGIVAYLIMWGIFTGLLFIGTLKISKALQFVFASLTLLFFLLALGDITESAAIKTFTGYEGIICGASAIYTGMATLLNEVYGKTIMPVGAVTKK
ncbi:acetate uptake transporter [Flavobacterium sangjuense]|uniref:Succinate-acetate/proton symporter SatP n=1 Tax=Flavobacterium sangjuense TaxID=2518177 RepID=A0A4P7PTQ8_9FLAO|nr:GPR1/FUN34/YaaH family transporter [Flavobacterium sangjuense]QBZ98076.1 Succinate-acetate/proton symporter SatP [Flavobacterium sangjuense]